MEERSFDVLSAAFVLLSVRETSFVLLSVHRKERLGQGRERSSEIERWPRMDCIQSSCGKNVEIHVSIRKKLFID